MLITHLGTTRSRLLAAIAQLDDAHINYATPQHPDWTIAQVVRHVADAETQIAGEILGALSGPGGVVAAYAPGELRAKIDSWHAGPPPSIGAATRDELVQWLETSRFRHLQQVFNETHERVLAQKSVVHPQFGAISLKNLADLIWLHDECHLPEIEARVRHPETTR